MKELFLQFTDADGVDQEVLVEGEECVIGRHSDCDIVIKDSRLSREHCKIKRFADVFVISDLNSSNGTFKNDEDLTEPVGIERTDIFSFGGLEVAVRFDPDETEGEKEDEEDESSTAVGAGSGGSGGANAANASGSGSGLKTALIVAPIAGLFLILVVGIGAILLIGSSSGSSGGSNGSGEQARRDRIPFGDGQDLDNNQTETEGTPETVSTATPLSDTGPATNATETPGGSGGPLVNTDPTPIVTESTPGGTAPKFDKESEKTIYSFLRRIATNDNRPVLTNDKVRTVVSRAGRFRGSSAVAGNIRNAASNKAAIKAIASEKGLKPQFLATAAIARLGNTRGDVVAKAREMADTLDKLTIVLSNELADDSLLVIAAFDEGSAGNTLRMRDRLARLTKQNSNASPREIRTIWYLRDKNEISTSQFDNALNFLAIGTITQNPSKFGVKAPTLRLD